MISLCKYKKIIIAIALLILAVTLCYFYAYNTYLSVPISNMEKVGIKITYDCHLLQNNSVGNEWITGLIINDEEIYSSYEGFFKPNSIIKITAFAIEDDTYPDVGAKKISIPIKALDNKSKIERSINTVVREDRGRYTGNTATWQFNITVERKVRIKDILSYYF